MSPASPETCRCCQCGAAAGEGALADCHYCEEKICGACRAAGVVNCKACLPPREELTDMWAETGGPTPGHLMSTVVWCGPEEARGRDVNTGTWYCNLEQEVDRYAEWMANERRRYGVDTDAETARLDREYAEDVIPEVW